MGRGESGLGQSFIEHLTCAAHLRSTRNHPHCNTLRATPPSYLSPTFFHIAPHFKGQASFTLPHISSHLTAPDMHQAGLVPHAGLCNPLVHRRHLSTTWGVDGEEEQHVMLLDLRGEMGEGGREEAQEGMSG